MLACMQRQHWQPPLSTVPSAGDGDFVRWSLMPLVPVIDDLRRRRPAALAEGLTSTAGPQTSLTTLFSLFKQHDHTVNFCLEVSEVLACAILFEKPALEWMLGPNWRSTPASEPTAAVRALMCSCELLVSDLFFWIMASRHAVVRYALTLRFNFRILSACLVRAPEADFDALLEHVPPFADAGSVVKGLLATFVDVLADHHKLDDPQQRYARPFCAVNAALEGYIDCLAVVLHRDHAAMLTGDASRPPVVPPASIPGVVKALVSDVSRWVSWPQVLPIQTRTSAAESSGSASTSSTRDGAAAAPSSLTRACTLAEALARRVGDSSATEEADDNASKDFGRLFDCPLLAALTAIYYACTGPCASDALAALTAASGAQTVIQLLQVMFDANPARTASSSSSVSQGGAGAGASSAASSKAMFSSPAAASSSSSASTSSACRCAYGLPRITSASMTASKAAAAASSSSSSFPTIRPAGGPVAVVAASRRSLAWTSVSLRRRAGRPSGR